MLTLAHISGWDISYELATNFVLALGIFVVLVCQIRITLRSIGHGRTNWLLPTTALIIFSLTQWENWLWGWQIQIFLNVLAATGGIVLLANPPFKWSRFLMALLLGLVATCSFANGICYWPIGLLILFLVSENKKTSMTLWAVAGLFIVSLYFYNYHKPSHHPSLWIAFERPLDCVKYAIKYLGAFVANSGTASAFVAGSLGLVNVCGTIWLLIRRRFKLPVLVPFIGLSLYAISSALITGMGRLGFESTQALSSRYRTISSLFWFSNVVLLYLLVGNNQARTKRSKSYIWLSILATIISLTVASSFHARANFDRKYHTLAPARNALMTIDNTENNDELLTRLCWSADLVKKESLLLKKYRLSVFRDSECIN